MPQYWHFSPEPPEPLDPAWQPTITLIIRLTETRWFLDHRQPTSRFHKLMNEWRKKIKSSFLGTSSSRDFRNNFLQIWKWGNEVWKLSSLFYNGARTRTHCSQEYFEDETISSIAGASSAEYHTLSPAAGGHKSENVNIMACHLLIIFPTINLPGVSSQPDTETVLGSLL